MGVYRWIDRLSYLSSSIIGGGGRVVERMVERILDLVGQERETVGIILLSQYFGYLGHQLRVMIEE